MLKIILLRVRGLENLNSKVKPESDEIKLLSEIFQAARIIFEHIMLNIKLPSNAFVFGFDIPELNEFISKMSL